ncbi:MAG: PQQ-like beta-propeller repeat protein [Planctomycetes bacterium]|nr:PQQ-like beta-propeller repeat protein [Planctomycetota bacterium]
MERIQISLVSVVKHDGEVVWWSQPGGQPLDTTYSVPVVAEINGTRMFITGVADGSVVALKIGTGEKIWQFRLTKRGINVSPVVHNNRVYIGHSEENLDNTVMGRVVCIDATGTGDVTDTHEVWRVDGLKVGYASPALYEGRLYVIENKGLMHCLDADTGKEHWKFRTGRAAKGSPVIADGKMYLTEVNARFLILKLNDDGCELLDEEKFSDPDFGAIDMFGSPAISNGRIYLAAMHGVYCIGAKEPSVSATITPLGKPQNAPPGAKPATLAVYPAEVLLAAGSRQVFKARVFDDRGRYIKDVKPLWISSVPAIKVSPVGAASTPADSAGAIGFVMARFDGLEAMARIRVVPNLPFEQDFTDIAAGEAVAHWIGGGPPKFVVADLDGEMVLKKIARPDRKFMRSNIYMAAPGQTGYTIQADMAGTTKRRKLPDMGLIANRYRFELMGNLQQMRLITWVAMRRVESKIKFEWQADRWYTLKMRVDVNGASATVRGKVWPRGESEPSAWTIELVDPLGNTEGSPGLYGYAMADIYYDNVRVWQND